MRDVTFRGKRKDNSEWVYGYVIRGQDYLTGAGMTAIVDLDATFFPMNEIAGYTIVDHRTVGQFTGKFDKDGNKIFEGDIVQAEMDYGPAGMYLTNTVIRWTEDNGWQWGYFDMDTIIVIGNIHDNPDVHLGLNEP